MTFKTHDFLCSECAHEFTEMYWLSERDQVKCPECGNLELKVLIAPTRISTFSMASPEEKASIMRKRSEDHSLKELRKEPEKHGALGVERYMESNSPKSGYGGKGG